MSMFDTIRSSYNLGTEFTEVELQTKDIEDYGIGGTMSYYWISPDGILYYIDYVKTANFVKLEKDDPEYNEKIAFLNFKWVPNGNHGKVKPHMITKYINVYPSNWKGDYKKWPTLKLHFRYGKLQDFEDITGKNYD